MNFSRKTILVVGAALLAACGDKVTVAEYTPPATTAKVNFVEVTPATATVSTGASITFTAAVNADAGLATTVTWSASAGTVTTAGVFTAPATANPGLSVCATSTVDTGKKGCATVVVTAAPTAIPASVSIGSITTANLNTPVNPAAVAGQIDIRLNVNPGNQTVSKVVVLVGGIRADSQTFTAAQSAALRYAADEAVAAQTTFPQIVFSINTAAFNATTGVPTWTNGARAVQAQLYTTQSGTATAATASVATSLTFANIDTYTLTLGAWTATANSAPGFQYRRGNIAASVLPIAYTGRTMTAGSISFGGCDFGVGTRSRALTAPATGSLWTTTFDAADANGELASNVTNYEFDTAVCGTLPNAEGFTVTSNDANGTILLGAAAANAPAIRLDNLAPAVVALVGGAVLTPGTRTGGWVNDAVLFTSTNAASAANGAIAAVPPDFGVGNQTPRAAVGGVNVTTPAGLAESSAANNYTVSVFNRDLLGNESLNTDATFAVDRTVPTISLGGPTNNTGYNATTNTIAAAFVTGTFEGTSVMDPATGSALASGFLALGGTPLTVYQQRRNATGTQYFCPALGVFQASNIVCGSWIGTTQNFASAIQPGLSAVAAGDGYVYTTATVGDQAGNVSAVSAKTYAQDLTAAAASAIAPLIIPVDGSALAITGSMADALHLRGQQVGFALPDVFAPTSGVVAAAGSTNYFLPAAPAAIDAYNPTTLTTASAFNLSVPRWMAQWQTSDGAVMPAGSVFSAQFTADTVMAAAVNVGSVAAVAKAAVVNGASTAFVTNAFQFSAPSLLTTGLSGTSNISRDGGCGSTSLGYGTTRIVRVAAVGPTAVFANPFTRVQFWAYQGPGTLTASMNPTLSTGNLNASRAGYRLIGEVAQATVLDDATTRTWQYNLTWDPTADMLPYYGNSACSVADTYRIIAVGLNGGSALVSPSTAALSVWR